MTAISNMVALASVSCGIFYGVAGGLIGIFYPALKVSRLDLVASVMRLEMSDLGTALL
jgi:hypothetical protein